MEQKIFDSSYLLKPTTFLRDISYAFSPPPLEVAYLFLCFMAVTHSLKYTVSFSLVVPFAIACCHSLSLFVTCCQSMYHLSVFIKDLYLKSFYKNKK